MTEAEALRTAIIALTARLAIVEGRPTFLGQVLGAFNTDEAEKKRLAEIAESMKPHEWRDAAPGTPFGFSGDNDVPDDDLLRVFGPFMAALTRETNPVQLDSTGARFYLPGIKKRAGFGPASWGVVRDEVRIKWFTPWGSAWRTNAENLAAGIVPKAADVDRIFSKVYG